MSYNEFGSERTVYFARPISLQDTLERCEAGKLEHLFRMALSLLLSPWLYILLSGLRFVIDQKVFIVL